MYSKNSAFITWLNCIKINFLTDGNRYTIYIVDACFSVDSAGGNVNEIALFL